MVYTINGANAYLCCATFAEKNFDYIFRVYLRIHLVDAAIWNTYGVHKYARAPYAIRLRILIYTSVYRTRTQTTEYIWHCVRLISCCIL